MFELSRRGRRITAAIAVTLALQAHAAIADNILSLAKRSDRVIAVELSNTDSIAGVQFSVNARGGLRLQAYEGAGRSGEAGLEIYQYLKDDSTLNVVILAPYRASLPTGKGVIGEIAFTINTDAGADTVRVFFSGVVACGTAAQYLVMTTAQLAWDLQGRTVDHSAGFALEQNFPNPFNPSTTIGYQIEEPASVQMDVYDVAGRLINTLIDQYQAGGRYSVRWNSDDRRGSKVATGTYFARLQVGERVRVVKMILTR